MGPGGQLGSSPAPVLALGRGAGTTDAGPHPYRHHRPARSWPQPDRPRQQPLVLVVVVEVGEQGLEVGVAEGPDGHARRLLVAGRPAAVRVRVGRGGVGLGMVGLLELLAGAPLRATPACYPLLWGAGLFVLTAVKGSWAGCCGALLTAGGALALLDALGGGTSVLPGGPLGRLARHRAQRLFGVADAIGAG
jgi:hypothetical protein